MEAREHEVWTEDGRCLRVRVEGPEDGEVVIVHHGTPGTRYPYVKHVEEGVKRALRHVVYSRPGYEGSTRQPGRSFADCAGDTAALAKALGIGRFYVVGFSGGGPHALACAALLADRVISTAVVAGFAPLEADGLDWMAGMGEDNIKEFDALTKGDAELEQFIRGAAASMGEVKAADEYRDGAFKSLRSEADIEALTDLLIAYDLTSYQRIARDEIWGWFDDDKAILSDWGFDFSQIAVPLTIWHGEEDRTVPAAHGSWIDEKIPRAKFHRLPGEGHISLVERRYGDVLDELMTIGT